MEETVDTVLSPFAKLTKGIQNLGFGKKGGGDEAAVAVAAEATEEGEPAPGGSEASSEVKMDEYAAKVRDSGTRTRFTLL